MFDLQGQLQHQLAVAARLHCNAAHSADERLFCLRGVCLLQAANWLTQMGQLRAAGGLHTLPLAGRPCHAIYFSHCHMRSANDARNALPDAQSLCAVNLTAWYNRELCVAAADG